MKRVFTKIRRKMKKKTNQGGHPAYPAKKIKNHKKAIPPPGHEEPSQSFDTGKTPNT